MSKDASKEPQEVTDFNKELYSLFDSKSASASKIERITKMAMKSAKVITTGPQHHFPPPLLLLLQTETL